MAQSDIKLGNGQRFVMKRIDNKKPDKCLTALSNTTIGSSDCVDGDLSQVWYLASDGTLRHNNPAFQNKCVIYQPVFFGTAPFKLSLGSCDSIYSKFEYENSNLKIRNSNPPRCINLSGRDYGNGAIVDGFVCANAAKDTVTWISEPVMQEQEVQLDSELCRVNNGLNALFNKINTCATEDENIIIANFGKTVSDLQEDISDLKNNITNAFTSVDQLYNSNTSAKATDQIKERNKELKAKHEALSQDISKKEAIMNRSNQDFKDVKETVPEPQPKKILRFVEDYTAAVFAISYLFFIISGMCFYVMQSTSLVKGLVESFVIAVVLTIVIFMLFFR
jgi:hypothetical protein